MFFLVGGDLNLKEGEKIKLKVILCVLALATLAVPAAADKVDDLIWDLSYDASPTTRAEAAISLGRVGDERAVEPLIAALGDGNSDVRAAAAQALGKIGDPKAVEPLIIILRYDDAYSLARKQAIWALGMIGDARAVDPLISVLNNSGHPETQTLASEALGNIGDPRAVDPLIKALTDKDRFVRVSAAEALGEIGDPRAVGPLTKALDDHWIENYAAEALRKINESVANPPIEALDETGTAEPVEEPTTSSVPTVEEAPEETPRQTEKSPLPISVGAISLIAAVLFMEAKRDR